MSHKPLANLGDLRQLCEARISLSAECFCVHQDSGPLSVWPVGVTLESKVRLDEGRIVLTLPGEDTAVSFAAGITRAETEELGCD